MTRRLISPGYVELNRQLHADRADYGAAAAWHAEQVVKLCRDNGFKTVLDYGCGKGTLKPAMAAVDWSISVLEFDPAIEGKQKLPRTGAADLIVALDVMEHIEPEFVGNVLYTLKHLKPSAVFLSIATVPATKILPDGRNAHLLVHPGSWWAVKLGAYFKKVHDQEVPGNYMFVGTPLL